MADHNLPALANPYADYTQAIKDRLADVSKSFDPAFTSATNLEANTTRFTSAASKWQKWNGSSWVDLATTYAIAISGNSATATTLATARTINGVSFNGSSNITLTASTPNSVTFNNTGSGSASGTAFNGSSSITISYNTVGAPSVTGTGASGTWGISISGSAATVSDLAITNAKLADLSVTASKVADSTLTPAKLSTGSPTWTAAGALTPFGSLHEKRQALAASAIDLTVGNFFTKTITGTTTFTVTNVPTSGSAASIILELTNGGAYSITWWASIKWAGGTAPTLTSSGRDVLGFYTHDGGTTWNGLVLGKDMK